MKRLHSRHAWKRAILAVVMAAVLFAHAGAAGQGVHATGMDDAKQDKEEAEENKKDAETVLDSLQSSREEVKGKIAEMDVQMTELQGQISTLNQQKAELETKITETQAQLAQAKTEEAQQYSAMCERIRYMYENGDTDYIGVIMSAQNMSEMLNEPEYMTALASYDYEMLDRLVETREGIANTEVMLESDLKGVEQVTAETEAKATELDDLIAEKRNKLSEYDDLIKQQEDLIAEYDREVQAAANRIAQLEAAAMGNGGGNFVPYEGGALVWPCPSSTRITSYFGYRTPDGGYVNANHKGIDIGAPTGTPVVAAASGVVVIARYSNSAGNWIVISHGNGFYTVYMHSSQLLVSEGQTVNAGDTIMLVGSTGWSTGPHLHFGVGVGGYSSAYNVDPLNYFR